MLIGLVTLSVSAYPAVLIPPFSRRASNACCALSPALVERYRRPLTGHGFCTHPASHTAVGGHLSLGSSRQRHRAEFRSPVPENLPAWSTPRAHPRLARPGVA